MTGAVDPVAFARGAITRTQQLSLPEPERSKFVRAYYEGAAAALAAAGIEAAAKVIGDQAALIIAPRGFAGAVHLGHEKRSVFFKVGDASI